MLSLKRKSNLKTKFGSTFIPDLESLKTDPSKTLVSVSRTYGISRQAVSLIFFSMSGEKYNIYRRKKRQAILRKKFNPDVKIQRFASDRQKQNAEIQQRFVRMCFERGLKVVFPENVGLTAFIDGHPVLVVNASKFTQREDVPFYAFLINEYFLQENPDGFIACWNKDSESFYIIPSSALPSFSTRRIYIRKYKSNRSNAKNRYFEYENAWRQLCSDQ